MKHFDLKRTAALYHLDDLLAKGLITRYQQGRKYTYFVAESERVSGYFNEKISELQLLQQQLQSTTVQRHRPLKKGEKLTLSFVNYYDLEPDHREKLSQYYDIIDYSQTQLYISPEEFIKRAKDADVVVNNYACKTTEEIISQLPRTQYMHLTTHMYRYVDVDALKKYQIHLSNIPYSYKSVAVTEYVLAQTFALLRDTVEAAAQVRTGVNEFRYFQGEQLRGKKVIIFGTEIGAKDLIELFRGFGVEIAIYTEDPHQDPSFWGVSHFATREEVFETGDIFYFSWTGDEYKTLVGKIDKNFLDYIKRPVYIISVYKHKYIDYQYLRELLYSGMIKGIAFDSYPQIHEGQLNDAKRLMYLPNVLITPDIGWYTKESVKNMNAHTTEQLIAYAQGNTEFLLF
jgi:phosphoglycerate dehydrogenase-like enzyme